MTLVNRPIGMTLVNREKDAVVLPTTIFMSGLNI